MPTITSITAIGGKKLGKSQSNLLAKLETKHGVTLAAAPATRRNPFTGASATLEPLAVSLYDFIIDNYHRGLVKGSTAASMSNPNAIPTATWDAARHLFLAYWPDEYFSLID